MSDDGCEGSESTWIGYHCLIFSLKDALDELHHMDTYRRELKQLLVETGFHVIARLRKQTDLTSITDDEFYEMLHRLASADLHEIALQAEVTREEQFKMASVQTPRTSTEAKRKLLAKLEALASTEKNSSTLEVESAKRRIEEIKSTYEIASSDPFDIDLEMLDAPLKPTASSQLMKLLDEAWSKRRNVGDIYYGIEEDPDKMRQHLRDRVQTLEKLVREHRDLKQTAEPIVQRRRR
ncbi:hypothetical protein IPH19_03185 [Candidatus Uhrbacteria bacterium]|nr:MAG: hypothetical protein IPH19_03185 [Candidatus Uhrbacteria bacterium]